MDSVQYAIIGINGYGGTHLRAAEALEKEGFLTLRAVTEVFPERCREKLDELSARGVRIYDDYRDMLRSEKNLDAVSVPTPIPLHVPMTLAALERGCHVLLEKPPAVLVQDVDRMLEAVERSGRLCQVGFQNISDAMARELKQRLAAGEIGRVKDMVLVGPWRRLDSYYARAGWAGKLRLGGDWVLDGPLNNPLCHYVHEALFLACPREHATARPVRVQAELYRAHPIEGEDIVCARAELDGDAVLCTYLTLCSPESGPPTIEIVGENGTAKWKPGRYELDAGAGREEHESEPGTATRLMRNFLLALRGEEEPWSPLSETRNVILHNNGCFLSSGAIRPVPEDKVRRYTSEREGEEEQTATEVAGLMDIIAQASRERLLFSELGVEWAAGTRAVELDFEVFDPSPLVA